MNHKRKMGLKMGTHKTTTDDNNPEQKYNPAIDVEIGNYEIIIGRRYGLMYTLNDILIACWFIIGSIFFFSENTQGVGTWLFLIGSIQLLIRPIIRIIRNSHLKYIDSLRNK